jgi:serine/threonine protein kinase
MTNKAKTKPTPPTVSKETMVRGKEQIQKLYNDLFQDSTIYDRATSDDYFPKFERKELKLGKVLGKGGFGTVSEIKSFSLKGVKLGKKSRPLFTPEEEEEEYEHSTKHHKDQHEPKLFQSAARLFLAQHCIRPKKKNRMSVVVVSSGDPRYAIKQLSADVVRNPQKCLQGMMDLAIETRFLCALQHTNIVKCRGLSKTGPFHEDYFILLDRLYDTLETRIETKWKSRQSFSHSSVGKLVAPSQQSKLWEERLLYAFDLSAAVGYLHAQNILYRDLKPENIGFDCRNDIKLFDFGLCREVKDRDRVTATDSPVELYRLTADTGSPRYMAPGTYHKSKRKPVACVEGMFIFLTLLFL